MDWRPKAAVVAYAKTLSDAGTEEPWVSKGRRLVGGAN